MTSLVRVSWQTLITIYVPLHLLIHRLMGMYRISRLFILLVIVPISVLVALGIYSWYLNLTILQNTYVSKAGLSYWNTWTLNNRLFDAALILTILSMLTIPSRWTLIPFLSVISRLPQGIRRRLSFRLTIVWRVVEAVALFIFYLSIGGVSLTGTKIALLMVFLDEGSISMTSGQLSVLFSLPFTPDISEEVIISLMPALEAYQIWFGLLGTFLIFSAARLVMSIVTDIVTPDRDIYIIMAKGALVITCISMIEFLSVPMWVVNAGTWMSYAAVIVTIGASLFGALFLLIVRVRLGDAQARRKMKITQLEEELVRLQGELISLRQEYESGAIDKSEYRRHSNVLTEDQSSINDELRRLKIGGMIPFAGSPRRYMVTAGVMIVLVLMLPVIQALYYGIQMEGDKYIPWKFNMETKKEIAVTSWATGLQQMETKTLTDLTINATPQSEVESLTTVRQWDQTASYLKMKNQIGTNWMQLADSDIVYLKGHEYWIAPLTFDTPTITTSFINEHLYYTHTEGLLVIDAYSGDIVEGDDLVILLNRTQRVAFYYGEGRGFHRTVFVSVPGFDEVGNVSFSGVPDYTLSGFESWWYIVTMGPDGWSFAGQTLGILVQRDAEQRVNSILLQGLVTDSDPYIVVDPVGRIYYAVSVFIDYRLATGYAKEAYMRFLGVVLVNVENGEFTFYRQPSLGADNFIVLTYKHYYTWQDTPAWLQSQMKWPEGMYERQLSVAFVYHVSNGFVWRSGVDFHQSPEGSDTRYIIMRIGGEDYFVAIYTAEFRNSPGRNLAGIYVMGCGDKNFGRLVFYGSGETGVSTLLGPTAAVQAFETNDRVRTRLALWGQHRYGNILLYSLGG